MTKDSFKITFGGRPVIDVARAMQTCADHGFPDVHFRGKATRYACPTGSKPGVGHLLMRKADIDAIRQQPAVALEITYRDGTTQRRASLLGMIVIRDSMAFSGPADNPDSVYLVTFADDRHSKRRKPWAKAYNMRERRGTAYITSTLNGGVAWTWQQLVQDLWTGAIGGTAPTLPYTPHGTPEGVDCYKCDSALDALAELLVRIDCHLVHDPRSLLYTIRRSSDGKAALDSFDKAQRFYAWQSRAEQWPQADWPATIRVRFRRRPVPDDESNPYYTVDVTTTPAPSPIVAGSILVLDDDLFALGAGSPSNAATLSARASERMTEFVRRRTSIDYPALRSYKGFVPDAFELLGQTVAAVAFSDRGGDEGAALTTELFNAADFALTGWTWTDSQPPGAGASGDSCAPNYHIESAPTTFECDGMGAALIVEWAHSLVVGCVAPEDFAWVEASGTVYDGGAAPLAGVDVESSDSDPNVAGPNFVVIDTSGVDGTWSGKGRMIIDGTSPTPSFYVSFKASGYTELKYYNNPGPLTGVDFNP
jgi:hypothetical protein